MRAQQFAGILLLFVIIVSAAAYQRMTVKPAAPGLKEAQLSYEMEKLHLKQANLKRYDTLKYYAIIGMLGATKLSLLFFAIGYARAKIKQASVHTAHIGQHGEIPVRYNDLREFYKIAANLSMAEIEASSHNAHEQAYQISRQMIEDVTMYTRALGGRRGFGFSGDEQGIPAQAALPASTVVPTFAELLQNGMAAPGKPMILGFHDGQPQLRMLKDLKSLAIAGWQGSGKTMSTAYLIASSVLAHGAHVYIVDPHKNHEEGLYALVKPLEKTGHVHVINPFHTPNVIRNLEKILDQRLAGNAPSDPGILLVIDELASLAKMDCFDVLVAFLERCTEETRKANITFIGGSHKWTARHFKGRADIRGCMNSMLIHKTKPSQADLLLEDSHDKNLVKQIVRPGEAILSTDFSSAVLVAMPLCTRKDMETVADIVKDTYGTTRLSWDDDLELSPVQDRHAQQEMETLEVEPLEVIDSKGAEEITQAELLEARARTPRMTPEQQKKYPNGVIPFDVHRRKHLDSRKVAFRPDQITLEQIVEQFRKRQEVEPAFTQAELARQARISVGHLGNILRGQRPLTSQNKEKLYTILFLKENLKTVSARA